MENRVRMKVFGLAVVLGAGLALSGCKSAPELTKEQALTLVQAKYNQTAPVGAVVVVDSRGIVQGATAKLWERTKVYPNKYWADFKLTDAGKKAVKLASGGDTIEWRPDSVTDTSFKFTLTTAQANHFKVKDFGDIQDTVVAGADTAKSVNFTEAVDLTGVPDVLQQIAHNPGNTLSNRRHAEFALANGAWALHAIN